MLGTTTVAVGAPENDMANIDNSLGVSSHLFCKVFFMTGVARILDGLKHSIVRTLLHINRESISFPAVICSGVKIYMSNIYPGNFYLF